ncbi:PD-(D/E)XK nuclease family protein [Paraflavitalea speifideaquila]|uniref:PDDEXK-like family protein n=1 Tax=Paraflavitalea speifideaquila TaxID=3076558 RepID=UPI0028E982EB|nr:PD-(D/E)XK nuclease family protein [Paraflavitalea speifideiaquila]
MKLHTPFIAHLLDPAGTHAQGPLFFKTFIKKLLPDTLFENYDPAYVSVVDELWCGEGVGQIDLFINHSARHNPYAIVIENKINAGDQQLQLVRYKNYLDSLRHIQAGSKRIFYLKPLGGFPSEYSVEATLLADWQSQGLFQMISYKTHIIEWLEDCMDNIKAIKVRVMVEQYLQLLKSICNE